MTYLIKVEKNTLNINNIAVQFTGNIAEFKEINQQIIVRLDIPTTGFLTDNDFKNVYAIDVKGKIKWQIQNVRPVNNPNFQCAPIVNIQVLDDNLFVTDFMGRKYNVDIDTGNMNLKTVAK